MSKKRKERVLELLQKSIHSSIQEQTYQQHELNHLIAKKEANIATFESYLIEYQHNIDEKQSLSMQQLINQQGFLNQIAKTLVNERESLDVLTGKRNQLTEKLYNESHRVKAIEEAIDKTKRQRLDSVEQKLELMDLEQWMHHARHIQHKT